MSNRRKNLSLADMGIATGAYDATDTLLVQSQSKANHETLHMKDCIATSQPLSGYPMVSMSQFTGEISGAYTATWGANSELNDGTGTAYIHLQDTNGNYDHDEYDITLNQGTSVEKTFPFQFENKFTGSYFNTRIASRWQNFTQQKGSPNHWQLVEGNTNWSQWIDWADGETDDQAEDCKVKVTGPGTPDHWFHGRLWGRFVDCFNYKFRSDNMGNNNYLTYSQSMNIRIKKAGGPPV